MKPFVVYGSANGLKSIPLDSFSPGAWTTILGGGSVNSGDVLARFEDIPWLHRGVVARCNALSGMPFAIHDEDEDGDELEKNEYPFECNFRQLFYALYQDYILLARAYTFIDKNVLGGVPTSKRPQTSDGSKDYLRRFQPDTIEPQYNELAGLTGYKRTVGSKTIPLPPEVIAAWFVPPTKTETGYGVSDAMVALKAANVIHDLDQHLENYFENGAVNPTLIMLKQGFTQETDKQRFRDWLRRKVTGVKNANTVEPLEGEATTLTLGSPVKDLATTELTTTMREEIATALGVPQSVLFSNASNYATAMQDDLHFYDKTIKPDASNLAEVLNEMVFKPLGYALVFHPERMEMYQRLEAEKSTSLGVLVEKKIMTRMEARLATNLPAEPATDDPQYDEFTEKHEPQPVPPALAEANQQPPPDDVEDDEYTEDMKRWQAKALNRWNENQFAKALEFTSEAIPSTLKASIAGALEGCKSKDDIRAVFADAIHWQSYP